MAQPPQPVSLEEWEGFLQREPGAHLLQTSAWGRLKAAFGWKPVPVVHGPAGALILFRRLPLGFSIGYIPKGPVGPTSPAFWEEVERVCRRERAIFLKVEPDAWEGQVVDLTAGFAPSPHSIQPRRTLMIDLSGPEEQILARMKQKTRYNIRLAEKKGVTVRPWADLEGFQRLMLTTGQRDGFGVHSLAYYQAAYNQFHPGGACELLLAEYGDQPLAALMVFRHGPRAWYLYGASGEAERSRMPTYLLQWEAMRWARQAGCTEYDLWGVPDAGLEDLEAGFESRSDCLWGVYRFKRGFGGSLCRSAAAQDRVFNPLLYRAYQLRMRGAAPG